MRIDRATRVVHASPSAIFRAFSGHEAMIAWLPPSGMSGEMKSFDFSDGGSYRFRLTYDEPVGSPGKSTDDADDVEVQFGRIIPDRLIEQLVTFESDRPEFAGVMKMNWTFEPEGDATRVTIRAENVPSGISPEDHEAGMTSTLANLAGYVEDGGR